METNFGLYSQYYDLLYKDKDYKSESDYVIQKIRKILPGAKRLLELGCGTGNHATYLCKNGWTVAGLEQSEEMVARAMKKSIPGFEPRLSNIVKYDLREKFDAAISLFHVISYLTTNEDLTSCFQSTHKHLNSNGIFLFDIWYTPAVYALKPESRIKRIQGDGIFVTRLAEPVIHYNEDLVDVNYEIIIRSDSDKLTETVGEKHAMRHFSLPELKLLATSTGFEFIAAEEFLTGKTPGPDTWGVCCILQKKEI